MLVPDLNQALASEGKWEELGSRRRQEGRSVRQGTTLARRRPDAQWPRAPPSPCPAGKGPGLVLSCSVCRFRARRLPTRPHCARSGPEQAGWALPCECDLGCVALTAEELDPDVFCSRMFAWSHGEPACLTSVRPWGGRPLCCHQSCPCDAPSCPPPSCKPSRPHGGGKLPLSSVSSLGLCQLKLSEVKGSEPQPQLPTGRLPGQQWSALTAGKQTSLCPLFKSLPLRAGATACHPRPVSVGPAILLPSGP